MKQSRQQEQETKVATTPGGRDNSCKDQRVATSEYKELSGDVSKLSLQQLHRTESRDII